MLSIVDFVFVAAIEGGAARLVRDPAPAYCRKRRLFARTDRVAMTTLLGQPDYTTLPGSSCAAALLYPDHLNRGRGHQARIDYLRHYRNQAPDILCRIHDGDDNGAVAADQVRSMHFRGFAVSFQSVENRCARDL